jgi:hypothetical protein
VGQHFPYLPVRKHHGSPRPRSSTWGLWVVLGLLLLAVSGTVTHADQHRFTGRIHSMVPGDGVVPVDRSSTHDAEHLIAVDFRGAQVVRVWRDSENLAMWRERSTSLSRWPAGTFLVVVGSVAPTGRVRASRIEIPKADDGSPPSDAHRPDIGPGDSRRAQQRAGPRYRTSSSSRCWDPISRPRLAATSPTPPMLTRTCPRGRGGTPPEARSEPVAAEDARSGELRGLRGLGTRLV